MRNFFCLSLLGIFFLTTIDKVSCQNLSGESFPPLVSQEMDSVPQISVKNIDVEGNTVLQNQIDSLIRPLIGQTVSPAALNNLVDAITALYLQEGYITSRAILPSQNFADGIVKIEIREGEVESVVIQGASRLENYVRSRIRVGLGKPFNSRQLEDQLRLLKVNPLFKSIEVSLRAGSQENTSILDVFVGEANPFYGSVGIDNYSPPSVGSVEANLALGYRNVLGLGDGLSIRYSPRLQAFTGTYQVDTIYQIPLNPTDGTLQFRVSIENNTIIQEEFEELNLSQESQYYEISYRQPIIRNPREEFALSAGISYRNAQLFDFQGPSQLLIYTEDGNTRTSVISFGQDYVVREASGVWAVRSQFRFGTDLLFDVTTNSGNLPDGNFFSWLAQLQRIQILDRDNFLIVQGDLQLTPNSLLPSEQFVIGGAQSVRGYAQNARAGDSGFRLSIENQTTLVRNRQDNPVFLLAPFLDMGYVWNNNQFQAEQRFLIGVGLGLLWQPVTGMTLRLDYAPPLIYLNGRGNDLQDNGFYFSVNYNF